MRTTPLPAAGTRPAVREVGLRQPLDWLRRGFADLVRCPLPGLLHGLAATLFGVVLLAVARDKFWFLAGAFSGFLIVAPVVATGLYAISRGLEAGRRPTLADAWAVWRSLDARLVLFGVLLALAGTGWVVTSASLIITATGNAVRGPVDFVRLVVLDDGSWLFEVWLVLGALLAAPMFASSVVALPLLLDRNAGVLDAVLTSWRAVMASPAPLALWAGLILMLTLVGMATALIGLLLVVPWLAHSSWHAYRDLVEPDRPAGERHAGAR